MNTTKIKNRGFTLVELVVFIIVLGILAGGLLRAYSAVFLGTANSSKMTVVSGLAAKCVGWYIGQRRIYGYGSINVPGTTVPSFCTAPTGYNITTSANNTTIPPDTISNYKTITVNVSCGGVQQVSESLLVANY